MCRHNDEMERKDLFDVVQVRGIDALPFLHSQCAADLMPLADGQLRWSALLSPQGRVQFVVAVIRESSDAWWLLVPFERGNELVAALRRFVFRRKVAIEINVDRTVAATETGLDTGIDGIRLALVDRGSAPATLARAALDRFISAGLALIDAVAADRHLAHSLRLERFDAFSVKKGCYPGQEIVARTHFLGRNKRVLVRLEADPAVVWHSGDKLYVDGKEIGEIACAGRVGALAVLTQPAEPGHSLQLGPDRPVVMVADVIAGAS